jgi:hypothetical protein
MFVSKVPVAPLSEDISEDVLDKTLLRLLAVVAAALL